VTHAAAVGDSADLALRFRQGRSREGFHLAGHHAPSATPRRRRRPLQALLIGVRA